MPRIRARLLALCSARAGGARCAAEPRQSPAFFNRLAQCKQNLARFLSVSMFGLQEARFSVPAQAQQRGGAQPRSRPARTRRPPGLGLEVGEHGRNDVCATGRHLRANGRSPHRVMVLFAVSKAAATWRSKLATLCPDRGLPGLGPHRRGARSPSLVPAGHRRRAGLMVGAPISEGVRRDGVAAIFGLVRPNAMHDDGEFSRQRDLGALAPQTIRAL